MGYRSEVTIIGSKSICYRILSIDGLTAPNETYRLTTGDYLVHWDWIKWDTWYPDIRAVMAVLDEVDDDAFTDDHAVLFRFGEDETDVETLRFGDLEATMCYGVQLSVWGADPASEESKVA